MADKHIGYVSTETGIIDVPLLAKDFNGTGKDYALQIYETAIPATTAD